MAITKKRLLGDPVGSLFGSGSDVKFSLLGLCLVFNSFYCSQLTAAIADLTVTDVTTRAFSVVWVADEEVTDAKVRVFDDNTGQSEITASLTISLVSASHPQAHVQGIVKVDVTGLAADTDYFFDTETTSLSGVEVFPAPPAPLIAVRTAIQTVKENSNNGPITNDIILDQILDPDGVNPSTDTLLLVKVPSISPYPLSAFVGDGIAAPEAIVDLNNLFDQASGLSADVQPETVLQIMKYRGMRCALSDQKLTQSRRAPDHEEGVPNITEIEQPAACFSPNGVAADFNCDGRIGLGDFSLFLSNFGLANDPSSPNCAFNPDFDLSSDNRIGLGDFSLFLSVFGVVEP